jgi:hypothetical protein
VLALLANLDYEEVKPFFHLTLRGILSTSQEDFCQELGSPFWHYSLTELSRRWCEKVEKNLVNLDDLNDTIRQTQTSTMLGFLYLFKQMINVFGHRLAPFLPLGLKVVLAIYNQAMNSSVRSKNEDFDSSFIEEEEEEEEDNDDRRESKENYRDCLVAHRLRSLSLKVVTGNSVNKLERFVNLKITSS